MIEGLLFMSESDYPFDVVRLEQRGEITPEKLREMSGEKVDAPVETRTLEEFFRAAMSEAEWKGAKEIEEARRYQALVSWLKENLSGTRVYRVGQINIAVYILGRVASGNLLGISTRVVET